MRYKKDNVGVRLIQFSLPVFDIQPICNELTEKAWYLNLLIGQVFGSFVKFKCA